MGPHWFALLKAGAGGGSGAAWMDVASKLETPRRLADADALLERLRSALRGEDGHAFVVERAAG